MTPNEGNTNAIKHGLRSRTKRCGLVHAKLGKRFANAYGHCNSLRKAVEALVVERHGQVSLLQQAKIQSVLRLEEGIRACEKLMVESPKMDAAEVRQQRYAIAQWTIQRDSLLTELVGNAASTASPWDLLDQQRATIAQEARQCVDSTQCEQIAIETADATAGTPEAL